MNHRERNHTDARAAEAKLTRLEFAIVILVMLVLVAAVLVSGDRSGATFDTVKVTVLPGDTLWSLAERYPIEGRSTAQTVDLLADINELDGPAIHAGVALSVPAPASGAPQVAMR